MHERFLVHLQLWFVVSFVLRVPELEEGVISSVKAFGWSTGTLISMPGVPGARRANVPAATARNGAVPPRRWLTRNAPAVVASVPPRLRHCVHCGCWLTAERTVSTWAGGLCMRANNVEI